MSYGGKRKMTESDNNSISAIGVLCTPRSNEIGLYLYHNKHATVALKPKLLAAFVSGRYELEPEVPGRVAEWRECTSKG